MLLGDQQSANVSPSLGLPADFEQALLEIDESFNKTMKKLQVLHQKKIDLIIAYKKSQGAEELLKIRNELK